MNKQIKELNIRELMGEIDSEIDMAADFHDLPDSLTIGGLPIEIDTQNIARIRKDHWETFLDLTMLMMVVLARHCGEKLVNCDEMPVDALPDMRLERFGPEDDE